MTFLGTNYTKKSIIYLTKVKRWRMKKSEFRRLMKSLSNPLEFKQQLGDISDYFSTLTGELPPFIKQKDLIFWFQKSIAKETTMEAGLIRYFQNPYFVNRLLFGKGSTNYHGSLLHKDKDRYKKRYMEEGKKFLYSLFATGSFEVVDKEVEGPNFSSIYKNANYKKLARDARLFTQIKKEMIEKLLNKKSIYEDVEDIVDDQKNRGKMLQHLSYTSQEMRWNEYMALFRKVEEKQLQENAEINEKSKEITDEEAKKEPIKAKDFFKELRDVSMKKGEPPYNYRTNVLTIFKSDPLPAFIKDEDILRFIVSDSELADALIESKSRSNSLVIRLQQYPNLVKELRSTVTRLGLQGIAKKDTNKLILKIENSIAPAYPETSQRKLSDIRDAFQGRYALIGEEIIQAFANQYALDNKFDLTYPRDEKKLGELREFLDKSLTLNEHPTTIENQWYDLLYPFFKDDKLAENVSKRMAERVSYELDALPKEDKVKKDKPKKVAEVKEKKPLEEKKKSEPISVASVPLSKASEITRAESKPEEVPEPVKVVTPAPKEPTKPEPVKVVTPAPKEPTKPEPVKVVTPAPKEPIKPEPVKVEAKKPKEPIKPEPVKVEAKKPKEPIKPEPALPETPLASIVERDIWKKDSKKLTETTPSLAGSVDPSKSTLDENDIAFNQVKSQGTSFVEQRNKERYFISCQTKPKNISYQLVNFSRIPNDDYLLYAYAQVQTLKNAELDKDKYIFIHTDDEILRKSYLLICQLYHLPLASKYQNEIGSMDHVKAVQSRMKIIFNPPAPSFFSRLFAMFSPAKKIVPEKPKFGAPPPAANSKRSTRDIATSLHIQGKDIKPMSEVQILCLTVQGDIENYKKVSMTEKGEEIARFKLLEDHHLLQKLRAKSTEKSENEALDKVLAQITTLLPNYTKVQTQTVVDTPTPEIKRSFKK